MDALPAQLPFRDEDFAAPMPRHDGRELGQRLLAKYGERITGSILLPARAGRYEPLPRDLPPALAAALRNARHRPAVQPPGRGLGGWRARAAHFVVVTPTASGKTPVLHAAGAGGRDDQAGARRCTCSRPRRWRRTRSPSCSNSTAPASSACKAFTFDGDTPGDARQAIRLHGDIVVSNPDMLHQAILPHHTKWAQFFENLRYVVIDEVHTYRGVFGSHVANVLRRLKRVCAFYGVKPQFILCSATIGNPKAHAEALIEARGHGASPRAARPPATSTCCCGTRRW